MNSLHEDTKAIATLQALAALRGIAVEEVWADDGSTAWLLQRWGLSRQLESLDHLRAVLRHMGVQA